MIPKCGQVNTKMESKIDVNLKWRFLKNRALAAAGARFSLSARPNCEEKSTENRSQNRAQDGMHLGIDYHSILVGFGLQVRVEKRFKTDVEKHENF